MKDSHYCKNKHLDSNTIIYKTPVDNDIKPIIKWLNSFDGIFTRWSCQGDDNKPCQWPYIVIWIETMEETCKDVWALNFLMALFGYNTNVYNNIWHLLEPYIKSFPQITIEPMCTIGDIHTYHIKFSSHTDMMKIRSKLIKWQPKETYQLAEKIAL